TDESPTGTGSTVLSDASKTDDGSRWKWTSLDEMYFKVAYSKPQKEDGRPTTRTGLDQKDAAEDVKHVEKSYSTQDYQTNSGPEALYHEDLRCLADLLIRAKKDGPDAAQWTPDGSQDVSNQGVCC